MDADGSRSKGIARSLRKLGVKRPYLVQEGFQSWVKQGLRVKELKAETTFTILNETIYWRVSSYENSEDLKEDLMLLLAPVRVGAQAYSWIAGKLETNGIGLPTSPSSLDVQNRVLQAAVKLESQPSNAREPSAKVIAE